jgi:hypothetical protein
MIDDFLEVLLHGLSKDHSTKIIGASCRAETWLMEVVKSRLG